MRLCSLASAALMAVLLAACRPGIPDGHYGCEPDDPRSCPSGTRCLPLGPRHYCYADWSPDCGNGFIEPAEECDGTDFGGGAAEDFGCEPGDQLYCLRDLCLVYCTRCGNRRVEVTPSGGGEQCDDGNTESGDGCSETCQLETCGNGVLDQIDATQMEECDDGNVQPGDGCSPACRYEECGNGIIDYETGEHCDDGNALSYDGCASDCTVEFPFWSPWRSPLQSSRQRHMLAYDEARGRLVLFGGTDGAQTFGDTWEYDGTRWLRGTFPVSPEARQAAALVYDPDDQRCLLFAGVGNDLYTRNDLWAYDGVEWTPITSSTVPGTRGAFGMAYDRARHEAVVFGGVEYYNSQLLSDTWIFDGTDWLERSPTHVPPPRAGFGLAYDRVRQRVVLFGGADDYESPYSDTWEWDGTDWLAIHPAHSPPARAFPTLTWHGGFGGVVLFGGYDYGSTVFDDTWLWDGVDWTPITGDATPAPRVEHAAAWDEGRARLVVHGGRGLVEQSDAWFLTTQGWGSLSASFAPPDRLDGAATYDRHRRRIVIFGGWDTEGLLDDTWELVDGAWLPVQGGLRPGARSHAQLAYDREQHQVVLFGGWDGAGPLGDTWLFDGSDWVESVTTPAPPARYGHAMAYDPHRHRVVLYGGRGVGNAFLADTWELDTATGAWQQIDTPRFPTARYLPSMTWDAAREALVLFGGYLPDELYDDTWFYRDGTWTPLLSDRAPPARLRPLLVYDESRRRPILFGGSDGLGIPGEHGLGDTWELRQDGWHALSPVDPPAGREAMVGVWDAQRRRTVMVGGIPGTQEIWEFYFHGFGPVEDCDNGLDDDGDQRADCDDPDCAWLPTCGGTP